MVVQLAGINKDALTKYSAQSDNIPLSKKIDQLTLNGVTLTAADGTTTYNAQGILFGNRNFTYHTENTLVNKRDAAHNPHATGFKHHWFFEGLGGGDHSVASTGTDNTLAVNIYNTSNVHTTLATTETHNGITVPRLGQKSNIEATTLQNFEYGNTMHFVMVFKRPENAVETTPWQTLQMDPKFAFHQWGTSHPVFETWGSGGLPEKMLEFKDVTFENGNVYILDAICDNSVLSATLHEYNGSGPDNGWTAVQGTRRDDPTITTVVAGHYGFTSFTTNYGRNGSLTSIQNWLDHCICEICMTPVAINANDYLQTLKNRWEPFSSHRHSGSVNHSMQLTNTGPFQINNLINGYRAATHFPFDDGPHNMAAGGHIIFQHLDGLALKLNMLHFHYWHNTHVNMDMALYGSNDRVNWTKIFEWNQSNSTTYVNGYSDTTLNINGTDITVPARSSSDLAGTTIWNNESEYTNHSNAHGCRRYYFDNDKYYLVHMIKNIGALQHPNINPQHNTSFFQQEWEF